MISFLQWISRTESVQAALSGPVGPGCEPVASAFRGMARSWAQQEEFLPSRRCERPKITTQWRRARATISRISGTTSGPREPPLQPFLVRFNRSRARKTLQLRLACDNTGSNPVGDAKRSKRLHYSFSSLKRQHLSGSRNPFFGGVPQTVPEEHLLDHLLLIDFCTAPRCSNISQKILENAQNSADIASRPLSSTASVARVSTSTSAGKRTVLGQLGVPISKVIVGPCRHREITRVSVDTLLRTHGYPSDLVVSSQRPYQEM
jgi:hypothetical protein